MRGVSGPIINAAVEGIVDEAVVTRLIHHAGGRAGHVYGGTGKDHLRRKIHGYNRAARYTPWIVLIDLDSDAECAPPVREAWLPEPAPCLCFRIVVHEIEAWLIADAQTLSTCLSVAPSRIPSNPEDLKHPKDVMVGLARRSRRRNIREDMVPREGSGRRVGPAYTSRLVEYAATAWRPELAARRSDSLRRTIRCLEHLVAGSESART